MTSSSPLGGPFSGWPELETLDAEVRFSDLRSGVRLGTDRMAHTGSVSIACFVGVGSRDESAKLAGASHFLEHLLFKGTLARTSREINRAIDAIGGDFNAYTVREATVFYVRVPAPHADFAAQLLCVVVRAPRLDPSDVEIERGVILGELDGALDSPDDVVFMNLVEALFPDHPLGRETLGDAESLAAMSAEEIAGFHDRWYRPANLVVSAAGAVDHDRLAAIIDSSFESSDVGQRPIRVSPSNVLGADIAVTRPIEQTYLALGWRGVLATNPDRVALSVLNHAFGDGPSSRLHEEIRELRGLAYDVSSSAASNLDAGTQTIYVATAPEYLDTVRRIIDEQVESLMADGIDDEELAVAKGYLSGSMLMALEDSSSRMSRLGSAIQNHGRIIPVAESLAAIEAVTADDVRRVANAVFGQPHVESVVGPSED